MTITKDQRAVLEEDMDRTKAWVAQQFPDLDDKSRVKLEKAKNVTTIVDTLAAATGRTKTAINATMGRIAARGDAPPRRITGVE